LVDGGGGGRGECPTPCKKGGRIVRQGVLSGGKCPYFHPITAPDEDVVKRCVIRNVTSYVGQLRRRYIAVFIIGVLLSVDIFRLRISSARLWRGGDGATGMGRPTAAERTAVLRKATSLSGSGSRKPQWSAARQLFLVKQLL